MYNPKKIWRGIIRFRMSHTIKNKQKLILRSKRIRG